MLPTKPRFKLKKRVEALKRRRRVEIFLYKAAECSGVDSFQPFKGKTFKNSLLDSKDLPGGLG